MPGLSTACLNGNHTYCPSCTCTCHNPADTLFTPERPYRQPGPSAGWSGTDTSRDAEPVRAESQKGVLAYVLSTRDIGATVKEVREETGLHHGMASGALSVLHKKGHLARLTTKRCGCRIYIDPNHTQGRPHD